MQKALVIAGWGLALLLACFWVTVGDAPNAANDAAPSAAADKSRIRELEAELEATKAQLAETQAALETSVENAESWAGVLYEEAKYQARRAQSAQAEIEAGREFRDSVVGTIESLSAMAQAGADALARQHYGPVLERLGLDPQTKVEAHAIIQQAYANWFDYAFSTVASSETQATMPIESMEGWMTDRLRGVLPAESMNGYIAFQASIPNGMLGHHLHWQLSSQPFSEDGHVIVRDTLADAFSEGGYMPEAPPTSAAVYMRGLYAYARKQLVGQIGSEQLAVYDRYTTLQETLVSMVDEANVDDQD